METTAADGKNYQTRFYNLDAIIAVGYRVNSYPEGEYEVYRKKQDARYLSDFDRVVEETQRLQGTAKPKALTSGKKGKKR